MPPKRKKQTDINDSKEQKKPKNDTLTDTNIPLCKYDGDCYRKNPSHFQEMKHPKQYPLGYTSISTTKKKKKGSSSSSQSSSSDDYQPKKSKKKITKFQ